jgi:CubicO group peptidase (beta-lactamase class C family)
MPIEIVFPGKTWEARRPEQVGVDEAALAELARRLGDYQPEMEKIRPVDGELTLGAVVRDGYLVYSWGNPQAAFNWYSASKPVLATLLFFAIQRGLLRGPEAMIADQGWALVAKDRTMTFAHLANMMSGYACAERPGEAWGYNDYGIRLLALSLERACGRELNEAAMRCFAPLALEGGRILGPDNHKGHGVTLTPRDFARIGWFWINRGAWAGGQVLEREFFDKYMRPHVPRGIPRTVTPDKEPNDYLGIGSYGGGVNQQAYGGGRYGYTWWFNAAGAEADGIVWPDAPGDTFVASGFGGNIMVMMPGKRVVVAARGKWSRTRPQTNDLNGNLKLLAEAAR